MKAPTLILLMLGMLVFSGVVTAGTIYGTVTTAGAPSVVLPGITVSVRNSDRMTTTNAQGAYRIEAERGDKLVFSHVGYLPMMVTVDSNQRIDVALEVASAVMDEVVVQLTAAVRPKSSITGRHRPTVAHYRMGTLVQQHESYASFGDNGFMNPRMEALSTFAADVDVASYGNVRRMIHAGHLPDAGAVRVEEMINYFRYDDLPAPRQGDAVAIKTELSAAPWNKDHQLLRVALKAKDIPKEALAPSNFVFLIDVSGSMYAPNKLGLVKSSLKLLVDQLRPQDRVALVSYAGRAEVVLASTPGDQKMRVKDAIDALEASGSTAGGDGLKMAYELARTSYIAQGYNRIIMATDGDFNVGASSDQAMEDYVTAQQHTGVKISVLGFGMGNYKDSKLEAIANHGHGNYAYIDHIGEARKAMVSEFGATLFTVAKDVKIQVEFNPQLVQAYRLLGYENRLLEAEDFNNDAIQGGDMGVGHTVTALYEIIPVGVQSSSFVPSVDPLKYQSTTAKASANTAATMGELATVKFRYKEPADERSKVQQTVVGRQSLGAMSADFAFASAVAELGMLLRNSIYKQEADYGRLIARAQAGRGADKEGYRAEFIRLAQDAQALHSLERQAPK